MKRIPSTLLAFTLVLAIVVTPVFAANNQGLSWSVASGDRFDFSFTITTEGESPETEEIYFIITNNPGSIPDDIGNMNQIPSVSTDVKFANGSNTPAIFLAPTDAAVPVGNWSLLSSLMEAEAIPGYEDVNDPAYWGYKARTAFFIVEIQLRMEVKFLKSDGFLSLMSISFWNNTANSEMWKYEFSRTDVGVLGIIMDNILFVGIGVGVIVLLVLVKCIRRK